MVTEKGLMMLPHWGLLRQALNCFAFHTEFTGKSIMSPVMTDISHIIKKDRNMTRNVHYVSRDDRYITHHKERSIYHKECPFCLQEWPIYHKECPFCLQGWPICHTSQRMTDISPGMINIWPRLACTSPLLTDISWLFTETSPVEYVTRTDNVSMQKEFSL